MIPSLRMYHFRTGIVTMLHCDNLGRKTLSYKTLSYKAAKGSSKA